MVVLSNLPPPTEGIRIQQPQTGARVEDQDLGLGTLYVAESCVSWVGENGQGFSLQYPAISLHAVSRDLSTFPQECLYLMVDASASDSRTEKNPPSQPLKVLYRLSDEMANFNLNTTQVQVDKAGTSSKDLNFEPGQRDEPSDMPAAVENGVDDEEFGEEGENKIAEIRFVPLDKTVLDLLFKEMADCQALHPDEGEDFSDEELGEGAADVDIGEFYTADDEEAYLNEEGQAVLQRIMPQPSGPHGDSNDVDDAESMDTGQHDDPH